MTAKEARQLTERAQQKMLDDSRKRRDDEEKRALENERYLIEVATPREIALIEEKIANNLLKREISFATHEHGGIAVAKILATRLRSRGFVVSVRQKLIPEYRGSGEDGYAYARDAYWETYLNISW